ncbi:MAG: phosphoserine phosphatase SerB [Porticoccaceae bacterium]
MIEKIFLLTISGENKPGMCTQITSVLANNDAEILDIGQAVIHDTLSLGLLIGISENKDITKLVSTIELALNHCDIRIKTVEISEQDYSHWVAGRGKPKHVITLIARTLSARAIAEVSRVLANYGLDIYHVTRLTGRIPIDKIPEQTQACVEFIARGEVDSVMSLRTELMSLSSQLGVDLAYQEDNVYRRNRRLIVFDMDSTLIREEVIDELAREAGVGEQVVEITEATMRGELDFRESLRKRVSLLEGLPETVLEKVASQLHLNDGADRLIKQLRELGFKTAILSGGFDYFGNHLREKLGIDYVYANKLEIVDGKLTGKVLGDIVDADRKAALLAQLAAEQGLTLQQTIAVGDGANDLKMLGIAGMGVAFHAKPVVRESADYALTNLGLDAILYLMGYSDKD